MNREQITDKLRAWPIAVIAGVMMVLALMHSQVAFTVTLYGFAKVVSLGYLGYWIDRWLFPYARPHEQGEAQAGACMRRAIIVAACIVAAGLIP